MTPAARALRIGLHFTWLLLALVGVGIAFLVSAISRYRGPMGRGRGPTSASG